MNRSFKLRLLPTKSQREAFGEILSDSCETYNAALQERREAWKLQRKRISLYEQFGELTKLRNDSCFAKIAVDIQREPLRRLDYAFKAFFRRCKIGQKPGFPRFRPRDRYDSFGWSDHPPRIYSDKLIVPGVGHVRFKSHREITGTPKQVIVKQVGKKWSARVVCDIGPAPEKRSVSRAVGIDVGVNALVTMSNGQAIDNPRWAKKYAARMAAASRNLALKQRRSKNRIRAREILRRACQRATNARSNYLHHTSKWLVANYDLIAYEDLKIQNMARSASGTVENPGTNVAQKSGLNRSIMDAAWGELIRQITYKAEEAGKWVAPVNPRGTSIRCSGCGADVRKTLANRQHSCSCGLSLNRDHNAALNILALGETALGRSAALKQNGQDMTNYPEVELW